MKMTFRFNILTIFLLISLALMVFSKNSGKSKKKKPSLPRLSDNIENNPFLQIRNTTEVVNYQGNPFLSNSSGLPLTFFGNSEQNQAIKPSKATENYNFSMAVYIRNPYLQGAPNTNSLTVPNSPYITVTVPSEKISQDEVPSKTVSQDEVSSDTVSYINSKTKSELKCEEYGKQVLGTIEVLSLVGANSEVIEITDPKCKNTNRLVVGGVTAFSGEFPHMVALGTRTVLGTFSFSCGGTLIAPEWVLTAAHCTYGPKSPTDARIGSNNLKDNQHGITTTINKILRHPNYKPPAMYADIALIKLSTVITFNKEIRPACLYQQYDSVPTQAWVTGWGVIEFGGEEQSDQLQKALLDIVDNIACAIKHNQSIAVPYGITPSMICAGDPHGGWNKDTCQGDSGGPLQIVHPTNTCLFQVLGITSFGQGCAVVNIPGVYTRVSHYLNWIEDTVWL